MDEVTILATILGMAAVTLLVRVGPLALLGGRRLPSLVEASLKHLPIAVLAAMVVQLLAVREGRLQVALNDVTLWAALPTFAVAIWTRNLFATLAAGMGTVALARLAGLG